MSDAIDAEAAALIAAAESRHLSEQERVFANRLIRLLDCGYDVDRAEELAADPHVDVHVVEQLLGKGATLDETYRIVA